MVKCCYLLMSRGLGYVLVVTSLSLIHTFHFENMFSIENAKKYFLNCFNKKNLVHSNLYN